MPVFIDMEEISYDVSRFDKANLFIQLKQKFARLFVRP